MGITVSSDIAKALWPGLRLWFNKNYKEHPAEYAQVFTKVTSDKAYEESVGWVDLGYAKRKFETQDIQMDSFSQGFVRRTTNEAWALGYKVSREAIADNQYSKIALRDTKALARALAVTKEQNAANFLDLAFDASQTFADGVRLCSTAHVTKTGLTFSNRLTTDADLSEAALEQMWIDIGNATNERGIKIRLIPKTLVINQALQFEADRILNSTKRVGTAENDKNAIGSKGLDVVALHYTSNADDWYILTNLPGDEGLIYQEREAPMFDNDTTFGSKDLVFSAMERYKFDCLDVRAIWGSAGA
jgi:phage major head subunit gpT-like protein